MVANTFINALQATWDDANVNHEGVKLTVYNLASNTESTYFKYCLDSNSSPKMWGRIDGVYFGNGYFTGNSTANVFANSTLIKIANSTGIANLQPGRMTIGSSVVNTTALALGANVVINTTDAFVGNSTANLFANSILFKVANSTGIANLQPGLLTIGTSVINSTVISATNLKFGTRTVIAGETISGYITVTDAGGTSRKLAVVS